MSDVQCTLMGDVVFTASVTANITLTVSGPTTYSTNVAIAAGTWFASALHAMQYIVNEWNTDHSGQMTVTLVSDPIDANYAKLAFVPETGLGTVTAFSVTIPTFFSSFGFATATTALGSGTSTKYTPAVVPYVLTPYWPLAVYERGMDTIASGYSGYAEDGTVYSVAAAPQERLTLSFALDRYQDYAETTVWLTIWTGIWSRGRSVAFYLNRDDLPAAWSSDIGPGGVSLVSEKIEALEFTRLVDRTNAVDYTKAHPFLVRPGGRLARETGV